MRRLHMLLTPKVFPFCYPLVLDSVQLGIHLMNKVRVHTEGCSYRGFGAFLYAGLTGTAR